MLFVSSTVLKLINKALVRDGGGGGHSIYKFSFLHNVRLITYYMSSFEELDV
jgi:hypothetical protein